MSYFSSTTWGPLSTPKVIKWLIIITCITATASAAIQELFDLFIIFPGPQNILSLSWWGLKNGFIWEPLTFLFVQDAPQGLTLSFFFILAFNMYILWIIGTNVAQAIGDSAFLRLYFSAGIGAGLITLLIMPLTNQYEMIAGLTPALLAVVTVWAMAFPETEIWLFFLIPFKAKWIVAGAVGILVLIALTHLQIPLLVLYLSAVAIGYAYAGIAWGWSSPFPITQKFDAWLARSGLSMRRHTPHWLSKGKKTENISEGKIIDITDAQPIKDDDAFVDAMLAKISKHGEESLSWSEKRRLQGISERKMHDKK